MPQRTIFESLADAGADWNVYYHDYASVLLFRYPWLHLDQIHKWDKFADDVAKGDLPQYTWLEPQCVATATWRLPCLPHVCVCVWGAVCRATLT